MWGVYLCRIAQEIFLDLMKNGYLNEKTINQLYCLSCTRFLADRYVEGVCPKCQYEVISKLYIDYRMREVINVIDVAAY